MTHSIRWWLPLSFAILLPACNASPGSAATPEATAAVEVEAAAAPAAGDEADYVLSMDDVDAYLATIGTISAAARENPDLEDIATMDASESVDEFAARLESDTTATALVTVGGLEVREFAQIGSALFAGLMTAGAMETGALKAIPDGIDPRHVEFARMHMAELKAKMAALQASTAD